MSTNHIIGVACVIIGMLAIIIVLGDLLVRILVALLALSLINYGLRLRGLPPLQLLLPMLASRKRWF